MEAGVEQRSMFEQRGPKCQNSKQHLCKFLWKFLSFSIPNSTCFSSTDLICKPGAEPGASPVLTKPTPE